jgi:TusA-related sulfurtransferase
MTTNKKITTKPSWDANGMVIKAIKPGCLAFENLIQDPATRGTQCQESTLIYDSLALRYNKAEPGDLLMVELPNKPSTSNLRKTIENRGMKEADYRLFRPMRDEHGNPFPKNMRPLVLQRITDKMMRTVLPHQAIAARMAEEAEERGASYNFVQDEKPAKPGPARQFSAGIQDMVNT